MNQSNKTSPVLYSASELRHRDQLREINQQQVQGKKQLQKSFTDIRDVDDFRQALMQEPADTPDPFGGSSGANSATALPVSRFEQQGEGGSHDDGQESKGRWITESAIEQIASSQAPKAAKSGQDAGSLLREIGISNLEWQQFELETATVGVLCFSVKRDEQGICLRLSAQDGNIEEVLQAHGETIALDLSKALGLNVRLVGKAHG